MRWSMHKNSPAIGPLQHVLDITEFGSHQKADNANCAHERIEDLWQEEPSQEEGWNKEPTSKDRQLHLKDPPPTRASLQSGTPVKPATDPPKPASKKQKKDVWVPTIEAMIKSCDGMSFVWCVVLPAMVKQWYSVQARVNNCNQECTNNNLWIQCVLSNDSSNTLCRLLASNLSLAKPFSGVVFTCFLTMTRSPTTNSLCFLLVFLGSQ